MQTDMHFYATYAIAKAAGLTSKDAFTVAYSAQFVDDSNKQDSKKYRDGGLLYGIATAHHPAHAAVNARLYKVEEQRRVWVPFHFLPGGHGETLEEKLICVKDSKIANELFKNHILTAANKVFGLHLIGIASHVYMDTFSHYGFSGISSDYNEVDGKSIKFITKLNRGIEYYIREKAKKFLGKYKTRFPSFIGEKGSKALGHGSACTLLGHGAVCTLLEKVKKSLDKCKTRLMSFVGEKGSKALRHGSACTLLEKVKKSLDKCKTRLMSYVGEKGSRALGHGAVSTYPDRPFLHWSCRFEIERPENEAVSDRNNPETFFEGCRKLHEHLSTFAQKRYGNSSDPRIEFSSIKDDVKKVLNFQGRKDERIEQWQDFIKSRYDEQNVSYSDENWEKQKNNSEEAKDSAQGIDTDIYRFHQAALYHRCYVLKDLLPSHKISVY